MFKLQARKIFSRIIQSRLDCKFKLSKSLDRRFCSTNPNIENTEYSPVAVSILVGVTALAGFGCYKLFSPPPVGNVSKSHELFEIIRPKYIQEAQKLLKENKIIVINGASGVGKSVLATQVCSKGENAYSVICKQRNIVGTMERVAIEHEVDLRTAPTALDVKRALYTCPKFLARSKVIFVFENVRLNNSEEMKELMDYLADLPRNCKVIITSQDDGLANVLGKKLNVPCKNMLLVEEFTEDEANSYLSELAKILSRQELKELLNKIHYHPVRLRLVNAVLRERLFTVKEYLQEYEKISRSSRGTPSHPEFEIAVDRLLQGYGKVGTIGWNILQLAAHLDGDFIPLELFSNSLDTGNGNTDSIGNTGSNRSNNEKGMMENMTELFSFQPSSASSTSTSQQVVLDCSSISDEDYRAAVKTLQLLSLIEVTYTSTTTNATSNSTANRNDRQGQIGKFAVKLHRSIQQEVLQYATVHEDFRMNQPLIARKLIWLTTTNFLDNLPRRVNQEKYVNMVDRWLPTVDDVVNQIDRSLVTIENGDKGTEESTGLLLAEASQFLSRTATVGESVGRTSSSLRYRLKLLEVQQILLKHYRETIEVADVIANIEAIAGCYSTMGNKVEAANYSLKAQEMRKGNPSKKTN